MQTNYKPNEHYDINPNHPDAQALSGPFIGEIERLGSGVNIPAGTYSSHLACSNDPKRRLTLPANGHIVVHDVSREGWRRICDEIIGIAGSDASWEGIERAVAQAHSLRALPVIETSIGSATKGAHH